MTMEGVGSEVSLKIRSAIKAKLVELGTYVDEELPDYIMVLVANKKTKDQMDDDLSLFLGHNTERFTSWLHHVLQKLNAAALLQVVPSSQPDESKKKDTEDEKKRLKEEEKKREKDEAKKREKAEEMKKVKDEEKKKTKEKDKQEKKKKLDRKEKNLKVEVDDEDTTEKVKKEKNRDGKEKPKPAENDEEEAEDAQISSSGVASSGKKIKPLVRSTSKVSSADIFRAEAGEEAKEGEEVVDDMLVLRPEVDELGLELAEEESALKKAKSEQRKKIVAPRTSSSSRENVEVESKIESKVKRSKHGSPSTRTSAKERLGRLTPSKSDHSKEKPSVLDRLGSSSSSSRRIINLREESSFPPRSESSSNGSNSGMARAVSSAISSAQRSVCVLPSSSSSGKKLEARVRPLMSRHVESSRDDHSREGSSRSGTSRVVSAVGAVLKRSHKEMDSDDEEYDPKKPMLGSMASKIEVIPRPKRSGAIQANTALILRAVADAHKSVNKSSSRRHSDKSESPKKKHKGEIYTRSYRERELAQKKEEPEKDVKLRKIAITVPNATRKESEKHQQEESMLMSEIGSIVTKKTVEKRKPSRPIAVEECDMGAPDDTYEVEEMEGLEEDDYIERMDEQVVQLPHRKVPVFAGDKTKFIVTMEGLDQDGYPVRTERPDIRSRLGARPVHSDGLEEVEEYIEEVEEWEEMEDSINEGNEVMPVDDDDAKTKVKSSITAPAITEAVKKPSERERCKYWPVCKTGDTCPFHHPTVNCKVFPNCKFGDKCAYVHPKCAYDGACTRVGCAYTHYIPKNPAVVAASMKHKMVVLPPHRPAKIKCRYFPKCTNMSCPYLHPRACFYGTSCKQANCLYSHPEIPTGAKLKWIAPKTSTIAPTITPKDPTAAVEEKPLETATAE